MNGINLHFESLLPLQAQTGVNIKVHETFQKHFKGQNYKKWWQPPQAYITYIKKYQLELLFVLACVVQCSVYIHLLYWYDIIVNMLRCWVHFSIQKNTPLPSPPQKKKKKKKSNSPKVANNIFWLVQKLELCNEKLISTVIQYGFCW